jgi:hypothetical protein
MLTIAEQDQLNAIEIQLKLWLETASAVPPHHVITYDSTTLVQQLSQLIIQLERLRFGQHTT